MYSGYILVGYMWLKIAVTAQAKLDAGQGNADFYTAKLHCADFYFGRLLTRTRSHIAAIRSGASNLMSMDEALFKI